jgi:hypothetical protein
LLILLASCFSGPPPPEQQARTADESIVNETNALPLDYCGFLGEADELERSAVWCRGGTRSTAASRPLTSDIFALHEVEIRLLEERCCESPARARYISTVLDVEA